MTYHLQETKDIHYPYLIICTNQTEQIYLNFNTFPTLSIKVLNQYLNLHYTITPQALLAILEDNQIHPISDMVKLRRILLKTPSKKNNLKKSSKSADKSSVSFDNKL